MRVTNVAEEKEEEKEEEEEASVAATASDAALRVETEDPRERDRVTENASEATCVPIRRHPRRRLGVHRRGSRRFRSAG
jgi:prolyl-tRNA synthetase